MRVLARGCFVVFALFATAAGATKVPIPLDGATLNISFQLQPWIQVTGAGAPDGVSPNWDLFIRRSRVMINGDVGPYFSYLVQFDNPNFGRRGNVTGRVYLQDAWVGWAPTGISGGTVAYIEAGFLMLPISRHMLQSTTSYVTIDQHTESFRGMRETLGFRDLGAEVRGWALDKKLGFRAGLYEGVRGNANAFDPATNPNGELNPHGNPRIAGFVNYSLVGAEEGAWLYHGIYFTDKPIVSVGVAGVYQSLSTRGPNGVTDSKMASADVFGDLPMGGNQELAFQATGYRNDYGLGSQDTGWGAFADLGYRVGPFMPYVSYELFSGDACEAGVNVVCTSAQKADTRTFRAGLDFFVNKNVNHVKVEYAVGRSLTALSNPSVWSVTAQWNFLF